MSRNELSLLVVDDDFRVAALHASIADAMIGFRTEARVGSIAEARTALVDHPEIDLALSGTVGDAVPDIVRTTVPRQTSRISRLHCWSLVTPATVVMLAPLP